ncbi:unnamed protein product [Hydatigera taeniaeformis]|uniref:Uncharacterized protein n=1 Tax=Hydatigena taeniaeformis TaxID=6205 RepID=A0A0R3WP64_HYDTA|nr:unnamed protein product [Hydatigera taeniaeformis]
MQHSPQKKHSAEEDDVITCEKLQRKIHELELERNRILIEKQVLEENARAEHRLADKLITQTLRRRRSRHSSLRHHLSRRDRSMRSDTESSYASQSSTERRVKRRKGDRRGRLKPASKATEDDSSDNGEICEVSVSDLQPYKPSIYPKVCLIAGDSLHSCRNAANFHAFVYEAYADKAKKRDFQSANIFGIPSVTTLMLQKARLNLQAVERDLVTHAKTPDVDSPDYLEYLKKKYLL